ncbi:hypothetical protein, partial [Virgisporangium ochraceum]|uniref:hypothetical protein n=1 Tax=Virgisporangium ochraceum TaxID=65505 RepID=UPI0019429F3D
NPGPVLFNSLGGVGQPAVLTAPPGADARIMVFAQTDTMGIGTNKQSAPDFSYESPVDMGGPFVGQPSATVAGSGAVSVFAVGLDGRVHVRQQTSAGANSPYTSWQPIG